MTVHGPGGSEIEILRVHVAQQRVRPAPSAPPAPWLFAAAMAVALAIAVLGGLVLGFLAATQSGFGGSRWSETVQAHGRLQLLGWVGVFVAALSFEFVVRLNQRPALPAGRRALVLAGLGAGAVLVAVGQVWHRQVGFLWPSGALLLAVSSAGFAWLILRVPAARPFAVDLQPLFFRLAAGWLVASSVLTLVSVVRASGSVLPLGESRLAVELFVRGFVLNAIIAVALRAFPGHLGLRPPSVRQQGITLGVVNGSLIAWVLGSGAFALPASEPVRQAADLCFAGGILAFTVFLGVLSPLRTPRNGPNYRVLVPLAWLGLVAYALALAVAAVDSGFDDLTSYQQGGVRHIFMLGFMAPLMLAMAHIVLARLGTGRVKWEPMLTAAFAGLLLAWPLRVLPVLFVASPGPMGRMVLGMAAVVAAAALAAGALVAGANAVEIRRLVRGGPHRH